MKSCTPANRDELPDVEIVRKMRDGDANSFSLLVERYLPILWGRASRYYACVPGADMEDLVQEGMFALFRAVRGYNETSGIMFSTYAVTCINNSINTAARNHIRGGKQRSDIGLYDISEHDLYYQSNSHEKTLEDACMDSETTRLQAKQIKALLSGFERQVLSLYIKGHSYQETACSLSTSTKAVDNALQRVRRKLRPCMLAAGKASLVTQPKG